MAKKSVKISLATKFRLLYGASVLGIIAAALMVPEYFMERLADQGVERPAAELTRLRMNEWTQTHFQNAGAPSQIVAYYTSGSDVEGRKGPFFIRVHGRDDPAVRSQHRGVLRAFIRNPDQELVIERDNDQGRSVYRCFRAVRVEQSCMNTNCHGASAPLGRQFQPAQLVGIIDLTVPESTASTPMLWWTRGAFIVGGSLAALLAFILFAIITQRLVLRPVRQLRQVADKVTEGDMGVRSKIKTGDELQRLGESFNEMLEAIDEQHQKLQNANRALDLRLSELAEANVTLFQANKVKNEFLANVSHELRTPLNSIIGFADLLADNQDQRIGRYGGNISSAAKNLLSMINDLLDIAKIEAGKTDVRMDKVSVTDICNSLMGLMQPLAEKKQLTLKWQVDPDLPIVVTDATKLQQILYNLLSNAVKFTPAGGEVAVTGAHEVVEKDGKAAGEVTVSVADTGPGIAEADQQHIFDKFFQVDRTLTKESSGTGLGLSIAKELTTLLGGKLTLKSEPGHGSTFILQIPVAPPGSQQPTATSQ
jgi:signal transduction histidine kinase